MPTLRLELEFKRKIVGDAHTHAHAQLNGALVLINQQQSADLLSELI
jgi:hypothetical protein